MSHRTDPGPAPRAQVFTLEGVFAGLVIMLSVLFALQAVAAVPGGSGDSGSSSAHTVAQSTLTAMDDGTLRTAVLYWGSDGFHCTSETSYYRGAPDSCGSRPGELPPNDFGAALSGQLGPGYEYNVVLRYGAASGPGLERQRMVYRGQPGSGAVRARTSVPLANDDRFVAADGSQTGTSLSDDPDRLYASPLDGDATDDDPYTVVHVEVVVWRA